MNNQIRPLQNMLDKNPTKWTNRVMISTPTTGLIRMEWANARYSQTIPTNWSHVDIQNWMSPHIPLGYQVADAENLSAKVCVEQDFEWFLSIEHDNVLPPEALIKMNQYMIKGDVPVVGGLYFTKSVPPEPILYRGKGMGFYADWKLGEKVWVSGLPWGFTLIHGSLIKALWEESPEYVVNGTLTRRVFQAPNEAIRDPETGGWLAEAGTSDLQWCERVMKDGIFEKAGWPEYQKKDYPFLVDTSIFVKHIDNNGTMWPLSLPEDFAKGKKTWKEVM
jgi:hypothetical protein